MKSWDDSQTKNQPLKVVNLNYDSGKSMSFQVQQQVVVDCRKHYKVMVSCIFCDFEESMYTLQMYVRNFIQINNTLRVVYCVRSSAGEILWALYPGRPLKLVGYPYLLESNMKEGIDVLYWPVKFMVVIVSNMCDLHRSSLLAAN